MKALNEFRVIVFYSTHKTLLAEKALKERKIPAVVVPLPKEISSDCGLGLKFNVELEAQVIEALERANLNYSVIHPLANK